VFRHPSPNAEIGKLLASLTHSPERAHLVGAYTLGKAQRVIRMLRDAGYERPIYIHGAMEKLCRLYEAEGIALGPLAPATISSGQKGDFAGAIVVCPPTQISERWARRFPEPVASVASGWMRIRQRAKQAGVELPLVLSDHADWDELTATISELGAREVWVTHGREEALVHWCTLQGIPAKPLHLVGYEDEEEE
jgi:putative mRNA 3-end processing factor